MTVRVLMADDQALVRAGFRKLLESKPWIDIVAEAATGREALELAHKHLPDVILMDIRMPDLDGIGATREVTATTASRVLVLTTYDLDRYVFEALAVGASGFLLKDSPPEDLLQGVRVVASGEALLSPRVTTRLVREFVSTRMPRRDDVDRLDLLTPRELDVLRCIARGLSNAEIGRELFVSETTVKTHVASLLGKLRLRDRVHAVVFAFETGIARTASDSLRGRRRPQRRSRVPSPDGRSYTTAGTRTQRTADVAVPGPHSP
jgi:DNA-binding NarL/FixJ family response regulator